MRVTNSSYIAEYIGSFFFILCVIVSGGNALVVGGSLALVVFLISPLSGAHVNPAISLAMTLKGDIKPLEALGYMVTQFLGGASAYGAWALLN